MYNITYKVVVLINRWYRCKGEKKTSLYSKKSSLVSQVITLCMHNALNYTGFTIKMKMFSEKNTSDQVIGYAWHGNRGEQWSSDSSYYCHCLKLWPFKTSSVMKHEVWKDLNNHTCHFYVKKEDLVQHQGRWLLQGNAKVSSIP